MKALKLFLAMILLFSPAFSKTFLDYFNRLDCTYYNGKFHNENLVTLFGNNGRILYSTNAGKNWGSTFTNDFSFYLDCALELNSNTLFFCGKNGLLKKTSNFGKSWDKININTDATLNSICFSGKNGFIASEDGFIYTSKDGGVSWDKLSNIETSAFKRVKFLNNNTLIAIDLNCRIFISEDIGLTWKSFNANNEITSDNIKGFETNNNNLVVFTQNSILYSVDYGNNWKLKKDTLLYILGVKIKNNSKMEIISAHNIMDVYQYFDLFEFDIIKSDEIVKKDVNFDSNFYLKPSIPSGCCTNYYSKDLNTLVYGSYNSIVKKINDSIWTPISILYLNGAYNFFTLNKDTLYTGSYNAKVYHSFDGSTTWLPQSYNDIKIIDKTIIDMYFSKTGSGIAFKYGDHKIIKSNDFGSNYIESNFGSGYSENSFIGNENIFCKITFENIENKIKMKTYITYDGGLSVNSTLWNHFNVNGIKFLPDNSIIGLASRNDSINPTNNRKEKTSYIIKSIDSAKTWSFSLIDGIEANNFKYYNDSLSFLQTFDTTSLGEPIYTYFKSTDKFKSWEKVYESNILYLFPKEFKSKSNLFFSPFGDLIYTNNFGKSWEKLNDTSFNSTFFGTLATNENSIYLRGSRVLYQLKEGLFPDIFDKQSTVEETEVEASKVYIYSPYPNPCKNILEVDLLWVKGLDENSFKVSIFDINGNPIENLSLKNGYYLNDNMFKLIANIDNLVAGIYFINVNYDSYNYSRPFVVIK